MGKKFHVECIECDYDTWTSCEMDFGSEAIVAPYICQNCHELVDVWIGRFGKIIEKSQNLSAQNLLYKCPECHSANVKPWNCKLKPCPRCGSPMEKVSGPGNMIEWF
jgi:Zn finger protein HypA/HybF involved in hydrogenase expression